MNLMGLIYSFLFSALVLLAAILVSRLFFSKDAILCFASSFSNPGFFGIPLIAATLSEGAVFYVAPFIVLVNLLQWSYGVSLLTRDADRNALSLLKRLCKAPFMLALLIGLFFFITGLSMPDLFSRGIGYIADLNTPLAMFTIGIYFAQTNLKKMFCNLKLYLLAGVRLIIIPLIVQLAQMMQLI